MNCHLNEGNDINSGTWEYVGDGDPNTVETVKEVPKPPLI
jgi:hypothetical protein